MTGDPQPMTSATETARGLAAQIQDVRDVLRNDAVAAGIDVDRVDAAVDAALASYTEARVHAYIGVFVERDVRAALDLRRGGTEAVG